MKKDRNIILVEFISSLSEEDLRLIATRLTDRYSDDLPEALNFLSRHKRIDGVLKATKTADELYDLIDQMQSIAEKECDRRNMPVSKLKTEAV